MYNISKELFEAVMNKNYVITMIDLSKNNSYIYYYHNVDTDYKAKQEKISVNDFFFACKEWVLEQKNLTILSGTYLNTVKGFLQNKQYVGYAVIQQYLIDEYKTGNYYLKTKYKVKSYSEQQAVFDACEYIRKLNENSISFICTRKR